MKRALFFLLCLLMTSCTPSRILFEPKVSYVPVERDIACVPSAFPPLTEAEMQEAWGSELYVGRAFAKELDLYRAITSFKKALFLYRSNLENRKFDKEGPQNFPSERATIVLGQGASENENSEDRPTPSKTDSSGCFGKIPKTELSRLYEIEFCIIESYFLAGRYIDAVNFFGTASLQRALPSTFPAFRDLLVILWESYRNAGECEKAEQIYLLIEKHDEDLAVSLDLFLTLSHGKLPAANVFAEGSCHQKAVDTLTQNFVCQAKSPKTAEILNACLPGAGYWYVGEKRSAVTSFVINALFIWATYNFFERGYPAAGLITLSLETGWYFGGINGAALEAKYYNERLYHQTAECMMTDCKLFPALMLDFSF